MIKENHAVLVLIMLKLMENLFWGKDYLLPTFVVLGM
jgi:hypothetical protein